MCLCQKLLRKLYHQITKDEAEVLRRTWSEAPYLFQTKPASTLDRDKAGVQIQQKRSVSDPKLPARKYQRTIPNSLIPNRLQDRPLQAISIQLLSSTATKLIKTYPHEKNVRVLRSGDGLKIQSGKGTWGTFTKVFIAIERSDQKIEIQQLFRRACCYAFALLHKKGTSVKPIVQEIETEFPDAQDTKSKVYHILRIGTKWLAIVEQFASTVNRPPHLLTGLLCLLGSASAWERAPADDCRSALVNLFENTDICGRALEFTPFVGNVLTQILLERSFIDETYRLISPTKSLGTMPFSRSNQGGLQPGNDSISRTSQTIPKAKHVWKAPSLAAAYRAIPRLSHTDSEDAYILLTLLAFLATSEMIPMDLLIRGATPRGRWTAQGETGETDAICAGLDPELQTLLSEPQRLGNTLHALVLQSAVTKEFDQVYTMSETVARSILENLSPELLYFWRSQALLVAYRAIPWKYIEFPPDVKLYLPHLKHTLQAYQDRLGHFSASTRSDLILTLVEASRFPNLAWKRFAVDNAELAVRGLDDWYLHSCITQSRSLISRISGNMDQATKSLSNLDQGRLLRSADKRTHSASGQAAIQHSLNCIQVEDLSAAKRYLEDWSPLSKSPSSMENAILFRRDMMLGRVLRFQGEFEESLAYLESAGKIVENCKNLFFSEDLRDFTCDLADTLRELEDLVYAEQRLRAEILRRGNNSFSSSGGSLLELSLAEVLFAQKRFQEAEKLCLDIQTRPRLLKFEKLRLHIQLAKIRHIDCDYAKALSCWNEAMKEIRKFGMTNGRATRIIVVSISDVLRCLGQTSLMHESLKEVATLEQLAKPGGTQYWIAGLRHWSEFLQSRGVRSRM